MSAGQGRMRLLFLTAEGWPTFRADVAVLFGKYLPRHGIHADLLTEREVAASAPPSPWPGGRELLFTVPQARGAFYLVKLWCSLFGLLRAERGSLDAIQVRDLSVTALLALVAARMKGLRFFYWLSYPQSEGQIDRAKARGLKAGMRFWFPLIHGTLGRWLLYRIVLPHADHVFVQSRQMQRDIALQGVAVTCMTPVPMGVDMEALRPGEIEPADDPCLDGRRVLIYLGTLDRVRQIEVLFQMVALISVQVPNILLVLAGDTEDAAHRDWLKRQAVEAGVAEHVLWTGWLPAQQAWRYARAAEIGLSPVPRGFLLDMGSPTKAVEYMALGLPVVANDNPDQAQVIAESGAGLCVPLTARSFAEAVVGLLQDEEMRLSMSARGPHYIARSRAYDHIAREVAAVYHGFRL